MSGSEFLLKTALLSHRVKEAYNFSEKTILYDDLAKIIGSTEFDSFNISGARVMVVLPDGLLTYMLHLIMFLKGAVHVPLSTNSSSDRISIVIAKVEPHYLVTTSALAKQHAEILLFKLKVIELNESDLNPVEAGHFLIRSLALFAGDMHFKPTTIRYIIFTSGSTGTPKGVCLSSENILSAAFMNKDALGLDAERRSVIGVPHFDYYGLIQIYSHVVAGACMIYGGALIFPSDIKRKLGGGATDLVTVPFGLANIVRQTLKYNLKSFGELNVITSSSDTLSDDLISQVFEINPTIRLFDIYGLTEAGRACFSEITLKNFAKRNLGIPSQGVSIKLSEVSPSNPAGEIVISGPNVMIGYFRGIEDDYILVKHYAEMRTGDLGIIVQDGGFKLIGRIDHLINIRGRKLHPIEIERIALSFDAILEARASLIELEGEHKIRLELVIGDFIAFEESALRQALQRDLPPAFVPADIIFSQELKRTEIGNKLIR